MGGAGLCFVLGSECFVLVFMIVGSRLCFRGGCSQDSAVS
jgi:hypothetical protein